MASLISSLGKHKGPDPRGAHRLDPQVLRQAGILSDLNDPPQALKRARRLIHRGRYKEARLVIQPHVRGAKGLLKAAFYEQLARCALYLGRPEQFDFAQKALTVYRRAADAHGEGRMLFALGEMYIGEGRFREADESLVGAAACFARIDEKGRQALCAGLRSYARFRVGHLKKAEAHLQDARALIAGQDEPRVDGLLRLEAARIFALMGDGARASRELLVAERQLAVSGALRERMTARLLRAESILRAGDSQRAAAGLRRIAPEIAELDDPALCARQKYLLGEALLDDDPPQARISLMRARHLFAGLRAPFDIAYCDLRLAVVEQRIGLNPQGRIKNLALAEAHHWPIIAAEMRMLRATMTADSEPEQARRLLMQAQDFARQHQNKVLIARVFTLLGATGLISDDEPTDVESRSIVVEGRIEIYAQNAAFRAAGKGGMPLPRMSNAVSDEVITNDPRLRTAVAWLGAETSTTVQGMQKPKTRGVKLTA